MTENKTVKTAEKHREYSASEANKNNQKENAQPPGKTPRETKEDNMGER